MTINNTLNSKKLVQAFVFVGGNINIHMVSRIDKPTFKYD